MTQERRWTVAHLRPQHEYVEVMFNDSARIYRLMRDNPSFDSSVRTLTGAVGRRTAVAVQLSVEDDEVIDTVRP